MEPTSSSSSSSCGFSSFQPFFKSCPPSVAGQGRQLLFETYPTRSQQFVPPPTSTSTSTSTSTAYHPLHPPLRHHLSFLPIPYQPLGTGSMTTSLVSLPTTSSRGNASGTSSSSYVLPPPTYYTTTTPSSSSSSSSTIHVSYTDPLLNTGTTSTTTTTRFLAAKPYQQQQSKYASLTTVNCCYYPFSASTTTPLCQDDYLLPPHSCSSSGSVADRIPKMTTTLNPSLPIPPFLTSPPITSSNLSTNTSDDNTLLLLQQQNHPYPSMLTPQHHHHSTGGGPSISSISPRPSHHLYSNLTTFNTTTTPASMIHSYKHFPHSYFPIFQNNTTTTNPYVTAAPPPPPCCFPMESNSYAAAAAAAASPSLPLYPPPNSYLPTTDHIFGMDPDDGSLASVPLGEPKLAKAADGTIITVNTGRWQLDEHSRFLEGLALHGKDWPKVEKHVESRSATQARSHAQKYFRKINWNSRVLPCSLRLMDEAQRLRALFHEGGNNLYDPTLHAISLLDSSTKTFASNNTGDALCKVKSDQDAVVAFVCIPQPPPSELKKRGGDANNDENQENGVVKEQENRDSAKYMLGGFGPTFSCPNKFPSNINTMAPASTIEDSSICTSSDLGSSTITPPEDRSPFHSRGLCSPCTSSPPTASSPPVFSESREAKRIKVEEHRSISSRLSPPNSPCETYNLNNKGRVTVM